jgi:hypothetical protein
MSVVEERAVETRARQAQHECGHATASWALGIPFGRILLSGPQGLPMVEPLPGRVMVGQDWLIRCCGGIADQQRRGLSMRDSQILKLVFGDGTGDTFEMDDAETGEVAVRPSRLPPVSPGGDLHSIAVTLPEYPNSVGECIRIWRDSEKFAAECRPAIDALAAALLARAELTYDEAAEIAASAMTGRPATVIPEWARK